MQFQKGDRVLSRVCWEEFRGIYIGTIVTVYTQKCLVDWDVKGLARMQQTYFLALLTDELEEKIALYNLTI